MDLTFRMMQKHGTIEEIENMYRVSIKCKSTCVPSRIPL